jgi:hypothetical protein
MIIIDDIIIIIIIITVYLLSLFRVRLFNRIFSTTRLLLLQSFKCAQRLLTVECSKLILDTKPITWWRERTRQY